MTQLIPPFEINWKKTHFFCFFDIYKWNLLISENMDRWASAERRATHFCLQYLRKMKVFVLFFDVCKVCKVCKCVSGRNERKKAKVSNSFLGKGRLPYGAPDQ